MKKRGQAAMEFLMTYGWAILVVLVAIGALAYFGVLTPERFLPEKCIFAAGLYCSSYKVEADTGVTLKIDNALTKDITVTNIDLEEDDTVLCSFSGSVLLPTGDSDTFVASCSPALVSGSRFKAEIEIKYDESGGLPGIKKGGSIIAKVT